VICPVFMIDPVTQLPFFDITQRCRYQRIYVLTPVGR